MKGKSKGKKYRWNHPCSVPSFLYCSNLHIVVWVCLPAIQLVSEPWNQVVSSTDVTKSERIELLLCRNEESSEKTYYHHRATFVTNWYHTTKLSNLICLCHLLNCLHQAHAGLVVRIFKKLPKYPAYAIFLHKWRNSFTYVFLVTNDLSAADLVHVDFCQLNTHEPRTGCI